MLLLLFFNPFFDTYPDVDPSAAAVPCEFTTERTRYDEADVVIFHLPTLKRLPVKRHGHIWAAFSLESEVREHRLRDPAFMSQFDFTITYQRGSDVWWPYVGPESLPALMTPPVAKTESVPVAHFQSNPFDLSGRNAYTLELIKRIKVASYGRVLPTVANPGQIEGRDARLRVIARHRFTLAFENSIAPDYVSDKFFDILAAGSVPVYRGAPNVAEFAPAPHSYIDVADFSSPAELARYLTHLDMREEEYEEYLSWKRDGPSPAFLALLDEVPPQPFCRLAELAHARTASNGDAESTYEAASVSRSFRRS